MVGWPTRSEAEKIWQEGITYRLSRPYNFSLKEEYCFHTKGVAAAAEKIAFYIAGMDSEKAYVLGLLHDYGKRVCERTENKFHGQEGYEQMMAMGYPDVAQVCLTHTFPDEKVNREQFIFPAQWLDWAENKLQGVVYTDYDYLIAFCDKLLEGFSVVSIEERIEAIVKRYGLSEKQRDLLYRQSIRLKKYFDAKTGHNVYDILEIKEK